jgi:hypothetical protein
MHNKITVQSPRVSDKYINIRFRDQRIFHKASILRALSKIFVLLASFIFKAVNMLTLTNKLPRDFAKFLEPF